MLKADVLEKVKVVFLQNHSRVVLVEDFFALQCAVNNMVSLFPVGWDLLVLLGHC